MRRLAVGLGLCLLVLSAGCIGDDIRFESQAAGVEASALTKTGYTLAGNETRTVTQTVALGDRNRTVRLDIHRRTYERTVADGNGSTGTAQVTVLSSPAVDLGGASRNPLAGQATRSLLADLQDLPFESLQLLGDEQYTVLGQHLSMSRYGYDGRTFGILRLRHDGDLLIVHTTAPDTLPTSEQFRALLEGLVHPTS